MLEPFVTTKSPNGKVIDKKYNPLIDKIWENWTPLDAPRNPLVLAALAESGPNPISTRSDGALEVETFMARRTGEALIMITDPGRAMNLMNNWIHLDTITGTGLLPFILPSSIYMEQSSGLTVNLRDISGFANTIYFNMNGRKIYKDAPHPEIDRYFESKKNLINTSFFLTTDGGAITIPAVIGSTITVRATVPPLFDFYMKKISGMSTGDYEISVRHNGIPLTEGNIHDELFCGTGAFPKILREPHLIRKKEQLELTFTNLIGPANVVYLTFSGTANFLNIE